MEPLETSADHPVFPRADRPADDVRHPHRMGRGAGDPRRFQGAHADHRRQPDPAEFSGVRQFRPDRPHLHSSGPDLEADPAGGHHQLRLQPQSQRLGRRHRHALSPVFAAGREQRQHRQDSWPEPGDQLVRLHDHRRRSVQQRSGDDAAGLEAQQFGLATGRCVIAAGQRRLSGGVSVFQAPRVVDSRRGNQPAIAAHGGAAIAFGRVELVADGGGDLHSAAEQTGLSAGARRAVDQRDCRGHHAHSGGAGCA